MAACRSQREHRSLVFASPAQRARVEDHRVDIDESKLSIPARSRSTKCRLSSPGFDLELIVGPFRFRVADRDKPQKLQCLNGIVGAPFKLHAAHSERNVQFTRGEAGPR